jgi:hypothetical protein
VIGVVLTAGAVRPQPQQDPDTPPIRAYLEAGTPGEHHRHLDPLVGTWSARFTIWAEEGAEPTETTGTIKRRWVLGGRFLEETVETKTETGPFNGIGYIGYDNLEGRYEIVWMDSVSTAMFTETATFDEDDRILRLRGSHRDAATGRTIDTWGELDLSDPDRQTFVGYAIDEDGDPRKTFESVTERQE